MIHTINEKYTLLRHFMGYSLNFYIILTTIRKKICIFFPGCFSGSFFSVGKARHTKALFPAYYLETPGCKEHTLLSKNHYQPDHLHDGKGSLCCDKSECCKFLPVDELVFSCFFKKKKIIN
jgi:hypothetical protein